MPLPNGGLITENNRQYYEGAQGFTGKASGDLTGQSFTTTFDTNLVFYSTVTTDPQYALNNFKVYVSPTGVGGSFTEVTAYTVSNNTVTITGAIAASATVVIQLKRLDGGVYGNTASEKAYGNTTEDNYGSYGYIKLNDIINNFIVAYIGNGKLIPSCKRTDIIFHAKRAMQEFSYDTLKSINSQELTIPNNLSVIMPQDYVNYVSMSWYDSQGIAHKIYPTKLTTNPYQTPVQDSEGQPTQDANSNNIESTSVVEERWKSNFYKNDQSADIDNALANGLYGNGVGYGYGGVYGLDPQYANANGWFTINDREGKFSFSSNLVDKLIVLEYISDGLSSSLDTRIPKMIEEAMYAYISHAIISTRINQPEYIVQRLKKEKSAKLRNAKIRLSNIKLDEIVQTMRGKSKWLKH
jgi:hypothetical protein